MRSGYNFGYHRIPSLRYRFPTQVDCCILLSAAEACNHHHRHCAMSSPPLLGEGGSDNLCIPCGPSTEVLVLCIDFQSSQPGSQLTQFDESSSFHLRQGRLLLLEGPLQDPNAPPLPPRQHLQFVPLLLPLGVSGTSVARQPLRHGRSSAVIALPLPPAPSVIVHVPLQGGHADPIAALGSQTSATTAARPSTRD